MKERSDNKTHQQKVQGRHVRPLASPVEAEKKGEPFVPSLEGERERVGREERPVSVHGEGRSTRVSRWAL